MVVTGYLRIHIALVDRKLLVYYVSVLSILGCIFFFFGRLLLLLFKWYYGFSCLVYPLDICMPCYLLVELIFGLEFFCRTAWQISLRNTGIPCFLLPERWSKGLVEQSISTSVLGGFSLPVRNYNRAYLTKGTLSKIE